MALEWMRKKMPDAQFISLGSILPSMKVQQENLARWNRFWHGSDRKAEMARTLKVRERNWFQYLGVRAVPAVAG